MFIDVSDVITEELRLQINIWIVNKYLVVNVLMILKMFLFIGIIELHVCNVLLRIQCLTLYGILMIMEKDGIKFLNFISNQQLGLQMKIKVMSSKDVLQLQLLK